MGRYSPLRVAHDTLISLEEEHVGEAEREALLADLHRFEHPGERELFEGHLPVPFHWRFAGRGRERSEVYLALYWEGGGGVIKKHILLKKQTTKNNNSSDKGSNRLTWGWV